MRTSSISSRLLGGNQSELAELKAKLAAQQAEITAIKSGGVGVDQAVLGETLKPLQDLITVADKSAKDALTGVNSVEDKVNLLAGVVDTNSTNTTTRLASLTNVITDAKAIAIANDSKISNLENAVPSRDELTLAVADMPKKADVTTVTALAKTVSDNKTASDATATGLASLLSTVTNNKTAQDAIKVTADKAAVDVAALTGRMVTAENIIGKRIAVRVNRQPTNLDLYEVGTVWEDVSFSETAPLRLITTAPGVWVFQSQVVLSKILLYCGGALSTYRSSISNVKFFKPDGTQIPNSHLVWGQASGIGGGTPGAAYTGQQIYCGYNSSGYVTIETSSLFDHSITIGKVTGDYPSNASFVQCSRIEFWYSNGSRKVYTATGYQANAGVTMAACDPVVQCKYGSAIAAAQGEMLTSAKLSDPNNNDYGRISGASLNSAIQNIVSPTAKSPSQADFDLLLNRVSQLESKLP